MKALICSDNPKRGPLANQMKSLNVEVSFSSTGVRAKKNIYENEFDLVLIDIHIQDSNVTDILSYVRLNFPFIKISIFSYNIELLSKINLSVKDIMELGVSSYFSLDLDQKNIKKVVSDNLFRIGRDEIIGDSEVVNVEITHGEGEEIEDMYFTHLPMESLVIGNTSIVDVYHKNYSNHYQKILEKGQIPDRKNLDILIEDFNIFHVYYKTEDRNKYLKSLNLIYQNIYNNSINVNQKSREKYYQERIDGYLRSYKLSEINNFDLRNGKSQCDQIYALLSKDKVMLSLFNNYIEVDEHSSVHSYLVAIFSAMICSKLTWGSNHTIETVAIGGLLHDIGKIYLPSELRGKDVNSLSESEVCVYEKHSFDGLQILDKFSSIDESVKQIIYQHHERVDGSGFPNGLKKNKIYPLAKVVGLADFFTHMMEKNKNSPLLALKCIIPDEKLTSQFEPAMIKALVEIFRK